MRGAENGPTAARPFLRVERISVTHGGVPAVVDLSLHVVGGEVVALLGRNGAGKTTTLRAIAGLQRVAGGSIELDSSPIHNRPAHVVAGSGCTLVQDSNRVFRRLTVETNLRLGAFHATRAQTEERLAAQYARFSVLAAKRDIVAGQLSGGEQQQLAIAQGMMAAPRVLMLDEPSVGLALPLVRTTFALLDELRTQGLAILLAEQGVEQPLRIADRAYVLDRGRIVLSGTATQLRAPGVLEDAYLGRVTT